MLLLVARLFQLTIVKGAYYRRLSEENRIRQILIEAKREASWTGKELFWPKTNGRRFPSSAEDSVKADLYVQEEAAHLVGYRQVANPAGHSQRYLPEQASPWRQGRKKGIEELYDCTLRGISGRKLVEVDANGKYLRTLPLSLLKTALTSILRWIRTPKKSSRSDTEQKRGCVGLNPRTGEILVFASSPSFNPQPLKTEMRPPHPTLPMNQNPFSTALPKAYIRPDRFLSFCFLGRF